MALVYILWRMNNGADAVFNVDTLAEDCACYACQTEEDLMNDLIAILANYAVRIDAIPELNITVDAACLQCEDELTLKRQALCLFCTWMGGLGLD